MAIYTPAQFASQDAQLARQLIAEHPFATLITQAAGEELQVSHIPLLCVDDVLYGHLATPNPHWQKFDQGSTLALFHGPHAYIDPHWYEKPAENVPTWNYAVVHVHGQPVLLDDTQKREHLGQLYAHLSPGQTLPTASVSLERLLKGIVAFRMPITRMDVKLKMSQNKGEADRRRLVAALLATGQMAETAVAGWMRSHD